VDGEVGVDDADARVGAHARSAHGVEDVFERQRGSVVEQGLVPLHRNGIEGGELAAKVGGKAAEGLDFGRGDFPVEEDEGHAEVVALGAESDAGVGAELLVDVEAKRDGGVARDIASVIDSCLPG